MKNKAVSLKMFLFCLVLSLQLIVNAEKTDVLSEQEKNSQETTENQTPSENSECYEPADAFNGEIKGRVVIIKGQPEKEKTIYIVGHVKAEDESQLSDTTLAELKRLGRKRLEVKGNKQSDAEKLNGKMIKAKGRISFLDMSITVETIIEEKPEESRASRGSNESVSSNSSNK